MPVWAWYITSDLPIGFWTVEVQFEGAEALGFRLFCVGRDFLEGD